MPRIFHRWSYLLVLALLAPGCSCLVESLDDGGEPLDGSVVLPEDGGGEDAGPGEQDGGDSGTDEGSDGGFDTGADAGPVIDAGYRGDGGPFTWEVMPLDVTYRRVSAVSGFSPDDVYAVTSLSSSPSDRLLHYDGNSSDEWAPLFSSGGDGRMCGVHALSNKRAVAAVAERALYYCKGGCADGGAYQVMGVPNTQFSASCANADEAFALGNEGAPLAVLWRSNHGAWTKYATFPSMTQSFTCAVAADGTVLVTGAGKLGLALRDGGSRVEDVVTDNWFESASAWFQGAQAMGDEVLLISGWSIVARNANGTMTRVHDGLEMLGTGNAMGGAHPDEIFVVGRDDGPSKVLRRYRGVWNVENAWETYSDWSGIWAASEDEIFVVGQEKNSNGGIVGARILHGKRF